MKKLDKLYSPKQQQILKRSREADWFMMINHGAVRAGKTVIDNDVFLMELKRAKKNAKADGNDPMYILGATSAGTLYTNVLKELSSKYGVTFKFDKYNNFTMFGVYVVTTFTGNIGGLQAIRGMTAYGAYINEMSLANKEVFDEIVKRCSGSGARILGDTNPDQPNHWLKVDYIDKADGKSIIAHQFTIFDNPFLSKRYVDNLIKSTPTGVFTERGIFGRWTSGEGAIYRDFNKERHSITRQQADEMTFVKYISGVDWGYDHYGSIVVIGITADGTHVLLEEIAERHKEIDFWEKKQKEVMLKYGMNIPFYPDSARPEYVYRFRQNSDHVHNANKSVLTGIEHVAKLMKTDSFLVVYEDCPRFADEIFQYSWHKTKDEPVKENDDVLDSIRYAILSHATMDDENNIDDNIQALQAYSL